MRNLLVLIIIAVIIDAAYAPGTQFPGTLSRRHARRDALIKGYFKAGYSNKDIALFLASVHGIKISVQWLKKVVRKLGLRRRFPQTEDTLRTLIEAIQGEIAAGGKWSTCFRFALVDCITTNLVLILYKFCTNFTLI